MTEQDGTIYKFTKAELEGIKKRREEILKFLNTIAEIRELPDNLVLNSDSTGFVVKKDA